MHKCFRPGDIILARVQSFGDTQSYIVTTAENELGVVSAKSEAGLWITCDVPISPKEHLDKKFQYQFLSSKKQASLRIILRLNPLGFREVLLGTFPKAS